MNITQLYAYLENKIPRELSCLWDNDGLMCCPDREAEVRRVLVALDVTGAVAEKAIREGYDLIVSHHPMIFSPLRALDPADHVAKKAIDLLRAGVSVMSFHTRLDAVHGGVNDVLAEKLGLENIRPFGENCEEIGRIGELPASLTLGEFVATVKQVTGAGKVQAVSAGKDVRVVAVLGGSGSDDVRAAKAAGADTYVSGELKHSYLTDAPDVGINLIAAGHFHTEHPVCQRLAEWIGQALPEAIVTVVSSDPVECI